MYRLTNTTHTEVAPSLPLPSLPICFGAASEDLLLFEERASAEEAKARDGSLLSAHAAKIAELLVATDISYLSVRDGLKNDLSHILSSPDSLISAVLEHDSAAFSFVKQGVIEGDYNVFKRGGMSQKMMTWQVPTGPPRRSFADVAFPADDVADCTDVMTW
ncbi:hypothetical protein L7F22_064169 [Adiantum nelumboides]|nr:hypothetical protein [Adiantum nelumboides]